MSATPVQTAYTEYPAVGFPGMVAAGRDGVDAVPAYNTDAVSLPWGFGVVRDNTAPYDGAGIGAKLPAATGNQFAGLVMYSHSNTIGGLAPDIDAIGPKVGSVFNVVRQGRIWAICENGCLPGNRLYVRCTAAGSGFGSLLSSDPGSSTVLVTVGKAGEWQTKAAAGALAVVNVTVDNA